MRQQLGHYDIVSELGRGGMGVVYKGYEPSLNRYVAIKVLADALAHDESVKERFLREARSMAALNDPHIIQIYFIGDDAGQTYFVMEFVDGESLSSVLKREGLLNPDQAARIIYQTAQGLSTAHDRGVIHRDIKPGNIMITSRGNVKIADFGIALSSQDFSKKLTSTGEFVGTPGYLSPEVCLGKQVDQRSDIFSLGIVLFEMLAGRMPFTEESPLGLMLEVVKAEVPDVCSLNAAVDPELARILSRMITKDPADRYQNCHELADDLARHPLVAGGSLLRLKTQQSTAAATVIGMKTPASGQNALPTTTPTPQPLPRMTPASIPSTPSAGRVTPASIPSTPSAPRMTPAPVAAVATAASTLPGAANTHEPVLQRQAAPAKSSALPLAIAALLLLALGAGAWAFRSQIPFLQPFFPPTSAPVATTIAPNVPQPSVSVTPPAPPTTNTVSTATPAPTAATTTAPLPTNSATPSSAAASTAVNTAPVTVPSPSDAAQAATVAATNGAALGPAPRASQVEPLKDLAAANAAAAQARPAPAPSAQVTAPTIAKITPPAPVAPPKPHVPTVAIVAGGDDLVAEPAAQVIERTLARHGYHITMARGSERFVGGARPNIPGLLDSLARSGVDAVVVVHVRATGGQNLQAYGQNVDATTAQLNVSAYAVQGQRKQGSWSENVWYSGASAKTQGEEAVQEIAPQVDSALSEFKPGHDRG